jgi:hypothetical protein
MTTISQKGKLDKQLMLLVIVAVTVDVLVSSFNVKKTLISAVSLKQVSC